MSKSRRILNVAEKPSVAKSISQILSNNMNLNRLRSATQYNPVFAFEYAFRRDGNHIAEMIFTSVAGHVMTYDYTSELKKWDIEVAKILYDKEPIKYVKKENKQIAENITQYGADSDTLILWLDCDREGENIAFEVIDIAKQRNRNIKILRAHFSSLVREDILRAMDNLRLPDEKLNNAVDVRQKIDLLSGYSFSILQTLFFKKHMAKFFPPNMKGSLSYGLCQFPTLNFVAQRCDEILNFQPQSFYYIDLILEKEHLGEKVRVKFDWEWQRLTDIRAVIIYNEDIEYEKIGEITKVNKSVTTRYRPYPLNTVNMQKLISSKLRINSEIIMKVAEDLYRDGLISYPRTETQVFSKNQSIRDLVANHTEHNEWGNFAKKLLENRDGIYEGPRKGKQDDKSHPPIHPIKPYEHNTKYTNNHKRVYDFITKYFLACVSTDAKGNQTSIEYTIADQKFHASGIEVTNKGYLEVYTFDKWTDKDLPEFILGEKIVPAESNIKVGSTTPPKFLTEKELISLMDKNGIGTDATIAEHIKTVLERNYCYRANGYFKSSIIGYSLLQAYKYIGIEIYQPGIRSNMEKKLKKVCDGEKDSEELYLELKANMKKIFNLVLERSDYMSQFLEKFIEANQNYEAELDKKAKSTSNINWRFDGGDNDGGNDGGQGDTGNDNGDNTGNQGGSGNYGGSRYQKNGGGDNHEYPKQKKAWKNDSDGLDRSKNNYQKKGGKGNQYTSGNNSNTYNRRSYNNDSIDDDEKLFNSILEEGASNKNALTKKNTSTAREFPSNNYNNQSNNYSRSNFQSKNNYSGSNNNIEQRGNFPTFKCVKCNSDSVIRNSSNGNYFIGCKSYPTCKATVSFGYAKSVQPTSNSCNNCGKKMFQISLENKEEVICISCYIESRLSFFEYISKSGQPNKPKSSNTQFQRKRQNKKNNNQDEDYDENY